ncbi:unnamed protein product [Zymoseptoria tritici ST99CH_3D7]|uniref:STB6-like N-terminal domain-containing protein n=1 Tax=Zymoseptoria tritici (strain ST99CH_3D7) TaxID=1276538 RepID=A0A1X7RRC7_ZYMT9|nr:unnamed protein product [Zymoseptoria tritici ST99CH_3D7]
MASRASLDLPRTRQQPHAIQTTHLGLSQSSLNNPPGSPSTSHPRDPNLDSNLEQDRSVPEVKADHQRFVLTDSVAFRYLQDDPSIKVLANRRELRGYECYIVEQWTTSRSHPTFVLTTYTGDPKHVVIAGVISVPTDEKSWSPRLRVYFKALNQYHARRQETPLGILMVTNLAAFPSSLTVLPVPDGDVSRHRYDFFLSENLKRLGCSGRVGLSLSQPAASTIAKFHQLYRTSDRNEVHQAVVELVTLCQSALSLFDKLEIDYADGLLCDVTERAINDWWVDMGSEQYNVEPHDGILGPTTVAGLLGLLMGARNRLHAVNAPVTKDPFDVDAMKRGIGAFQKQQRIPRTRRLDRRTLNQLQKVTQKAADKERWAVPKAVKSTVAELSGKGGEMVMDAVGRRDRASIAEIETVDIDRFAQLVYGDRCKWLWHGKAIKKSKTGDKHPRSPDKDQEAPHLNKDLVFKSDEHGGFTWTSGRKSTVDGAAPQKREQERHSDDISRTPGTPGEEGTETDNDAPKQSLIKRATGLRHDAKSGLGKVKEAVGLRGHKAKTSTDENIAVSPVTAGKRPSIARAYTTPVSSPSSPQAQSRKEFDAPVPAAVEQTNRLSRAIGRKRTITNESIPQISIHTSTSAESLPTATPAEKQHQTGLVDQKQGTDQNSNTTTSLTNVPSTSKTVYHGVDLDATLPTGPETELPTTNLLRRTLSSSAVHSSDPTAVNPSIHPRNLSFSLASSSVLSWPTLDDSDSEDPISSLPAQLASEIYLAKEAILLRSAITELHSTTATWTFSQISALDAILVKSTSDQEVLDALYEPHLHSVREWQTQSEGLMRSEKERFEEAGKEVETLAAKLEYEIAGLRGRVEDVKVGVGDFEKGVRRVEERVGELEKMGEKEVGWCNVM